MASTANFGLTLIASASRHSSTASMQRSSRSGEAWAASAADPVGHVRMVGRAPSPALRRHQQRVAEIGRQVDQRPVQRIARGPGLARLLPSLKVFDRPGGAAHRPGGALAGAAGPERRPQLFGLGLVAVRGQRHGLGFGRGHQLLGGGVGPRRRRGVAHQSQRPLPSLPGLAGRWPAGAPAPRDRR